MACCKWCKLEMSAPETRGCAGYDVDYPDGTKMRPIPYGEEVRFADVDHAPPTPTEAQRQEWREDCQQRRCSDCNIAGGSFHHPGCDMEECPRCHFQLISCGCLDEPDEKRDDDLPDGHTVH